MQKQIDFTKMTLEELTPIVSMRPGKLYTKEELQAARKAFMEALSPSSPGEDKMPEVFESSTPASEEAAENIILTNTVSSVDTVYTAPLPQTDEAVKKMTRSKSKLSMQADSKLAFFLYFLYAYITLPLVALHALTFLLAGVLTAVYIPDVPYLFLQILCTALYTMLVSFAWHQFMHQTRLGLILNRALILFWLFRGTFMLFEAETLLFGIVTVSLFFLFLVFFVGYDTAFVRQKNA